MLYSRNQHKFVKQFHQLKKKKVVMEKQNVLKTLNSILPC